MPAGRGCIHAVSSLGRSRLADLAAHTSGVLRKSSIFATIIRFECVSPHRNAFLLMPSRSNPCFSKSRIDLVFSSTMRTSTRSNLPLRLKQRERDCPAADPPSPVRLLEVDDDRRAMRKFRPFLLRYQPHAADRLSVHDDAPEGCPDRLQQREERLRLLERDGGMRSRYCATSGSLTIRFSRSRSLSRTGSKPTFSFIPPPGERSAPARG